MSGERPRSLRAESTGSVAESTIRGVLLGRGYVEQPDDRGVSQIAEQRVLFGAPRRRPTRYFVAQHQLPAGIYGLPLFTDFFIRGADEFPHGLALEVKWQQSTGSVDEKFPYLVLNIQERYPCPVVVVADGGGQRPGALAWLRSQVGGNLLGVYSLAEFLAWGNRHM